MREAWIIDAVRSPRGRGKPGVGSLSHIHPQRCLAQVLNALKDKVGFDPADIEDGPSARRSGRIKLCGIYHQPTRWHPVVRLSTRALRQHL